jgi:hypothetical protein
MQGGDEHQKIDGVCGTDETRNVLNCDIHNGLQDWRVTELVIRVTWAPYSEDDVRDFRQRISIAPLTTETIHVRLGAQLPTDTYLLGKADSHWSWLVVNAKGVPAQSAQN